MCNKILIGITLFLNHEKRIIMILKYFANNLILPFLMLLIVAVYFLLFIYFGHYRHIWCFNIQVFYVFSMHPIICLRNKNMFQTYFLFLAFFLKVQFHHRVILFNQSLVKLVNFKVVTRKSKQNEIFQKRLPCISSDYSIHLKKKLPK